MAYSIQVPKMTVAIIASATPYVKVPTENKYHLPMDGILSHTACIKHIKPIVCLRV